MSIFTLKHTYKIRIISTSLLLMWFCPAVLGQRFIRSDSGPSPIQNRWYVNDYDTIITQNLHPKGRTVDLRCLKAQVRGKVKTIIQTSVNYDTVGSNICIISHKKGKENYKLAKWLVFGPDTVVFFFNDNGQQQSVSIRSKSVVGYRKGLKNNCGISSKGPIKISYSPFKIFFYVNQNGRIVSTHQTVNCGEVPLLDFSCLDSTTIDNKTDFSNVSYSYDSLGREIRTCTNEEECLGTIGYAVPNDNFYNGCPLKIMEKNVTAFDTYGNITYRSYFDSQKSEIPELEMIWDYRYDDVGNWTHCDYYENGRLMRHIERDIVYY